MDEVAQFNFEIDEGRMKDIFTADQEGKSAKEIAKALKLPLETVKKILGEEVELQEFSRSQLDTLSKQYSDLKGKTISIDQANKLRKIFDRIPDAFLNDLRKKHIPFLSGLALSRMVKKGMPVRESFKVQITKKDGGKVIHGKYKTSQEAEKFIKWYKTGDMKGTKDVKVVKEEENISERGGANTSSKQGSFAKSRKPKYRFGYRVAEKDPAKGKELEEKKSAFRLSYDDRYGKHAGFEDAETLADLQNKAANLRKKGFKINKMGRNTSPVNEIRIRPKSVVESDPIQYGPDKVAKAMKIAVKSDGMYSKAVREIEKIGKDLSKVSTIARALKTANEDRHAGAKAVYEQIKGLKNKAEKTGMPYGILKKVYDRGMAAWRGGHRPGTTQQQWAFARVNSFVTKSSGTWGGADKDLAKQVKG